MYRSNKYCYGQIIDDAQGRTLAGLTLKEIQDIHKAKNKMEASYEVGRALAEKAKKVKVKSVVLDRGSYQYHGRVKKLAEGVREGGLKL